MGRYSNGVNGFNMIAQHHRSRKCVVPFVRGCNSVRTPSFAVGSSVPNEADYLDDDDDDEDDDEDELYATLASSEFTTDDGARASSDDDDAASSLDWGSALGSLRQRMDDVADGTSKSPANALFRLMTADSPNEAIGKFVTSANPEVLGAMSGAVSGLLGGLLSNPGMESSVKANGRRVASLCFQLQMTGYMFRNAEYVVALKELMQIRRVGATTSEFKEAFERLDADGSGYIEASEVEALLKDVYDGAAPAFEVRAFLGFFDANNDGRISWDEFEQGLGAVSEETALKNVLLLGNTNNNGSTSVDEDEEDDEIQLSEPTVAGTVEVEMEDGQLITVEATDYIKDLKDEAQKLKDALRRETGQVDATTPNSGDTTGMPGLTNQDNEAGGGGIAALIKSLGGDLKQLTEGISPEVVDAMKMLINFVLEGGDPTSNKKRATALSPEDMEREMELPGSALQQLALWQLVLGYRLREAEATGEYKKLLDN